MYFCGVCCNFSFSISSRARMSSELAGGFFFFFFLIYLFYLFSFGCVGSLLLHAGFLQLLRVGATPRCSARTSHCGGPSCCRVRAPGAWASVVVARRLQSAGSVVVAHGLRCSAACGIFPDQGSNPCPLHWQADSQPLRHQGSPAGGFLTTTPAGQSLCFVLFF